MKKRPLVLTLWVGLLMLMFPQYLQAHGTGCRIIQETKAVIAEFYYSDGETMRFSEVLVFSPADAQTEFQNGRTDQNGRFVFCPDQNGTWRIEANDGMGHKAVKSVEVLMQNKDGKNSPQNAGGQNIHSGDAPVLVKAVLGISLILNFCFAFSLWKRRTK
jgi:nickel transport protein